MKKLLFLLLIFLKRTIGDDTFFEDNSNTKWGEIYERCLKYGHSDISHTHSSQSGKRSESIDFNDIINIRTRNILMSHFESGTTFNLKPLLLWPNGRVPTDFDGEFSKDEKYRIHCAVAFFHTFTCVRFVKRKSRDRNYLLIKKSSVGCMSQEVGRIRGGGYQTINLQQRNNLCWNHGTIIHELMHAVGRFHEHSRMDRNDYIHIHFSSIPVNDRFQFHTTQQLGYDHEDVGYYDYESIMHYPSDIGDKQVISALFKGDYDQQARQNDAMGQRNRPTGQDEIKINLLYKCNERSTITSTAIERDGNHPDCGKNFKCNNGKCIPWNWECNGLNSCGDNSDEPPNCSDRNCLHNFKCKNGKCIQRGLLCDGVDNCGDNSDEPQNCYERNCKNGFVCQNGRCIASYNECDGYNDCGDNSDELQNCYKRNCPGNFKCANGKCTNEYYECDGEDDCGDNSDEPPTCSIRNCVNNFKCQNGNCIGSYSECDGDDDCGDNSDEPPSCRLRNCVKNFKCQNGKCIFKFHECDGIDNCGDNSDEQNCSEKNCSTNFKCQNGNCIRSYFECNGDDDCGDSSDEFPINPKCT